MSDGQLVQEVLSGRVESYDPLVRRWAARVLAVCHARVGRADAAEDLAQEALLRGLRAISTLSDPDRFGPWLCGIAVRCCLDWLKASARTEVTMSALPTPVEGEAVDDAGAQSSRQEEIRRLMTELERLPFSYRQVVMHFYYDDCTYKQIAEQLGISTATVNMRLTRARQLLRERLVAEEK
jgi:RNA polymerase sigma-70 factor (ECF subfamily)